MKIVGPATKTKSARISASTMLMLDSHWMPRAMPDTAEATNAHGQHRDDHDQNRVARLRRSRR